MKIAEIKKAIATMDLIEMREIMLSVQARRERIADGKRSAFTIGMEVEFTNKGRIHYGTITKINLKTVKVNVYKINDTKLTTIQRWSTYANSLTIG